MVLIPDDRLKQKMAKNNSVLQYMYSVAGLGKGLIAMGVMLIGIGVLLGMALLNVIGSQGAVKLAAAIVVPGILLVALGIFVQQKRESGWLEAYKKETGLSEQELHQIDEEFKQPGTVLFSLDNGKDTNSLKRIGFITANYIKFPGISPYICRLNDMVACFYTKKYLCQDGGYDRALIAYNNDGKLGYVQSSPPEKASLEIVKVIGEHNPKIITDHHFAYEGREYDAVRGMDEVIALHKEIYGNKEVRLKPVLSQTGYQPVQRTEPKKSGWEPWGWKRGVALVILFFVLMGIMYGPKVYRRYQMDHGNITTEEQGK